MLSIVAVTATVCRPSPSLSSTAKTVTVWAVYQLLDVNVRYAEEVAVVVMDVAKSS